MIYRGFASICPFSAGEALFGGRFVCPEGLQAEGKGGFFPHCEKPDPSSVQLGGVIFRLGLCNPERKGGGDFPKERRGGGGETRLPITVGWVGPNLRKRWLVACLIALEESEAGHAN